MNGNWAVGNEREKVKVGEDVRNVLEFFRAVIDGANFFSAELRAV